MKRSVKEFLSLFLSFALFSLLFVPACNFFFDKKFFEKDVSNSIASAIGTLPVFSQSYSTKGEMVFAIKNSEFSSLFQNLLTGIVERGEFVPTIAEAVGRYVYHVIVIIVVASVLLISCYTVLSTIFSMLFGKIYAGKSLFFTRRLLSGGVGVLRGVTLFVGLLFAVLFFTSLFSLDIVRLSVEQSNIARIGFDLLSGQVSSLLGKLSI